MLKAAQVIVGQFLHDMGEMGIVDDGQVFQDMMLSTFYSDTIFEKEYHENKAHPNNCNDDRHYFQVLLYQLCYTLLLSIEKLSSLDGADMSQLTLRIAHGPAIVGLNRR